MSTGTAVAIGRGKAKSNSERAHRLRVHVAALSAVFLVIALLANGIDYYRLPLALRPFSPKHEMLKPSGSIGLKLGIFGVLMFCCIFLYPIRKHWMWLQRKGNSKHWLDFHIIMGLTAPWIIACHSSFKFHGFAGLAFMMMTAVAISGIVGRYLYAQLPRQVNSAELSLKESQDLQGQLVSELSAQSYFRQEDLAPLFRLPAAEKASQLPLWRSLVYMIVLDIARPFHVARLRSRSLSVKERIFSLGGLFRSHHPELETIIDLARTQAALSKRVVFLSRAQRIFKLWHVVHKPFSFSFVVLVLIHISVVLLFGISRT